MCAVSCIFMMCHISFLIYPTLCMRSWEALWIARFTFKNAEIVKWGNGRHSAPLEQAITSGAAVNPVLTAQGWLQAPHPHTNSSLQRLRLLFTATNNRSKWMFTWIWSIAYNSIQPSLSQNLIDPDASVTSLSACAASWLRWLSD